MVDPVADVLARAQAARDRAARAEQVAARHEQLARTADDTLRPVHESMAVRHRAVWRRHVAAAAIHLSHAERLALRGAAGARDGRGFGGQSFVGAVSDALQVPSLTVCLGGSGRLDGLYVASSPAAARAFDLELTMAEGPAHDADRSGTVVFADGDSLARRWPHLGPALLEMGTRSVAAAPPLAGTVAGGALVLLDPPGLEGTGDLEFTQIVADAVGEVVLGWADELPADGDGDWPPGLDAETRHDVVHRAVGAVRARTGYDERGALALLRARAFATGRPVDVIAAGVLEGTVELHG